MTPQFSHEEPIGLVGLGLAGSALAQRMSRAGFSVLGFDIDADQCRNNAKQGVQIAASLKEIAEQCSRIVLSLPDSNIVEEVLLDDAGLLAYAQSSKTIIDTTTGDPSKVRFSAQALRQKGSAYCDACLVGSSVMIREGDCLVVLGAEAKIRKQIQDILESWTFRIFHMGEAGSGSDAKLVVNLVIGLNRLVLSESLVLASLLGLDIHAVLKVLRAGLSYSKVMDTKGPKMVEGDFTPQARLRQHLKDVKLINALGREHGFTLPLSSLHESILQKGVDFGLGDLDNSVIIEVLKRLKNDES